MNRRSMHLIAALCLTLLATWWVASEEEATSAAPPARGSAAPAREARAPVTPGQDEPLVLPAFAQRAALPREGADFATPLSFRPPPPLATAPRPMAPALPFRYVGAIEEDGERIALLMEGNQLRLVRVGDAIDERYRVERIAESAIDFIYLPLNQRQSLNTGRS